ncbi:hypothetical protein SAMN04487996_11338 [Dyadobacter soli]|uniref:Uncharacterized protein n=1 Tax=Dyadobacter soli TaxID=659014 RepID=A0A1G7PK55_9BACT|nr:hypothetical protein [Dyadobacter soli]SDF86637.1 hypothetical protein SAMN04487996_11338 [Dyadobacter soli]
MSLPQYQTELLKATDYEAYLSFLEVVCAYKFRSSGKNGEFQLRIFITRPKGYSENYFNLGFGVWNPERQTIDDVIELKNGDFQQILATIANVALDFLKTNPFASLYAEGSTRTRTRLYQREISKHYHLIPDDLKVHGLVTENETGFIEFRKGINFDAFLLSMK